MAVLRKTNRRSIGRALAAAMALLTTAAAVRADPPQRILLPVTINKVDKGELLAYLENDDVFLRVADLKAAGVSGFSGLRVPSPEGELVSLGSLAPGIVFTLDSESISLDVTTSVTHLPKKSVNLKPGRPEGITYSTDTSAFLNYSVNWRDFRSLDGFLETGVSFHGNLLYSSVSRDASGRFTRGLTNYTMDDRERLRRWIVGDGYVTGGALGGTFLLGGVGVSRNFDLDPYFVRYPTLGLAGAVTTPSTADVYVNGAIVRREVLPPGQFDLTNLPVPAGSGTASVVIRDAFGGERTLASPFYASTAVLGKGLSEYTYNVGFVRRPIGMIGGGPEYDPSPAFFGRHRLGVTDSLTPEARLEARAGLASAGAGVAQRLPVGEIDASVAGSRDHGESGLAGSFSYRYIARSFNAGIFARLHSARYANLGLAASDDRGLREAGGFAGLQVRAVSLAAQYETSQMRDSGTTERISLSASVPVTRDCNVFVSGGRSRRTGSAAGFEAFAGLSYLVGGGAIASVSHERAADGTSATAASLQKSLPLGTGYGYQVNAASGTAANNGRGVFQYQGPYGRYEASYERVLDQNVETLTASGGIVVIGGAILPSRPVGQSFALLRVPGVGGVTGFASNQPVGQTSARGDLLVPDLLPYYGNRLSIADTEIPLDYSIGETERIVAPPHRGGALITFPVERARAVTGKVRMTIDGRELVPAYGVLVLTPMGQLLESPIGGDGEFFLENLSPGRLQASVRYGSLSCAIEIIVPEVREQFSDLGTLRCEARQPVRK